MTNYFTSTLAGLKHISGNQEFSTDDSRPELLRAHHDLVREEVITPEKEDEIDELYKKWCDLLFSGYNVVVTGPNSKFALLETFKKRYLDSCRLLDWSSPSLEPLSITTVRLHGLDPIKMEAFNHAVLDIKEARRVKDSDYCSFSQMMKDDRVHYIFMIHSFEYFLDTSEEVCESIFKLYSMNPDYVHIITSSDHWNGAIKLKHLQHSLNFIYSSSVLPGIDSFLWEKTGLVGDFDQAETKGTDTTMHRLFTDKTDLQSLKDIHLALDDCTQEILVYIVKDMIDKTEAITNCATESRQKRFQALDAEDDEEHALKEEEKAGEIRPMRTRANNNNRSRRSIVLKDDTHLNFQHLLKHCESKFIIRRGTALRDHLGELDDHKLISYDDTGNNIKCLVDINIGKKFLAWIAEKTDCNN